jgi:PAS domain S-box-containing protein
MSHQGKNRKAKFLFDTSYKYAIRGSLFGLFMVVLTYGLFFFSDQFLINFNSLKSIHLNNPFIFIIDFLPILTALGAFFISRNIQIEKKMIHEELSSKNQLIQKYTDFFKIFKEGDLVTDEAIEGTPIGQEFIFDSIKKNYELRISLEKELNWVSQGKELITEIIRKNNDLNEFASDLLQNLIRYTGSVQGAFYLINEQDITIENIATYAYKRDKYFKQSFKIGEGLIGQSVYENEMIYRKQLPRNYMTITSGILGDKKPNSILIQPVTADEKVQGVIEIAFLSEHIPDKVISLIKELKEIIGQTIFNNKANFTTKKLLEESQKLTEQLKKNEEELRKNAHQMELTQIELQKSNIELASKISEVEQAQKRLNALLENASEVITIYDLNGIVQFVSPSVKNILGFDPEEMLGVNRFERGDKILRENFKELIKNPKQSIIFEYQYTNKLNERLWLETKGTNLFDNPAINGIIFNTRDITERKNIETAKKLTGEMRALSENSSDMIVRMGLQGNFYYANPVSYDFIGVKASEMIGNNINNIPAEETIINFIKEIANNTKLGGKEIQTETVFSINDVKRIVQFNSIPEFDSENNLITFLFVAHDITERKEIEIEIDNKNKNITESINYAQRIQSAIIPDFDIVRRYLPESFMFYRPRDVVSGDLPWFYSNQDETFVAAIDCTGHGVPGTLISFIGYFTLNEIVRNNKSVEVGQILDKLHYQIRKTLKQDSPDSKARDGMDIAICKINHSENILEFAGAHNTMFYLKNNESEVMRYRGDRKSVGGKPLSKTKEEENFTTYKINIQKKDKFFIFTDGLPDQIGGGDGRKYQASKIKEQIEEKNYFSMKEYYNYFVNEFNNWKEGYKQVDDILLIGVEL